MDCAFQPKPKISEKNAWVWVWAFHYFSCQFANVQRKGINLLVMKFDNVCLMCDKIVPQSTLGCMAWSVVYKCRYSMLLLKWHLKTTRWLRHKRQKKCRKLIMIFWVAYFNFRNRLEKMYLFIYFLFLCKLQNSL